MSKEVDMDLRQNFLSMNGKVARDSYGNFYKVGETVSHEDQTVGEAVILSFEPNEDIDEVKVITTKGYAHLDFLTKV